MFKGYSDTSTSVVGNCGDDTVITCENKTPNPNGTWTLIRNGTIIVSQAGITHENKYSVNETEKEIRITIPDTDVFKDTGLYVCVVGFTQIANITITTECK